MENLLPKFNLGIWARPIMVYWISNISRLRLYLTSLIILCLSLFLSSCGTSSLVFYEHGPSIEFGKSYDIDDPKLQPFKDSGVIFTVELRPMDYDKHIVWLGLSSQQEHRSVNVEKAIIQSADWQQVSVLGQEFFINKLFNQDDLLMGVVSKSYFDHDLLFLKNIKLFLVENELLEQAYQDGGHLNIQVFYQLEGQKGVMNYQLKRRVDTYLNYPI